MVVPSYHSSSASPPPPLLVQSNIMMSGNDEDSCISVMPDGRRLQLCSQEGADAFLRHTPTGSLFNWFTMNYGVCKRIRSWNNGELNDAAIQQLIMIGFSADSFSSNATPSVFAEAVPDEEIVFWIDYVIDELKRLKNDPGWLSSGTLERHDAFTLHPCISMFKHEAPARLALERGFFKAFAEFIQSRVAPLLPCQDVADTVCLTIGNSFVTLTSKDGIPFNDVKVRQIIGEWESIGMLKEFIRCSTFPQLGDQFHLPPAVLKIYESLSNTSCTY